MEIENKYASKGVAGAGLGLGIAGTALGLLQGNGLSGILGNGWGNGWMGAPANGCIPSENMPVTRYDAGKDARIAELETEVKLRDANIYTDSKLNDLRNYVDVKFAAVNDKLCAQAVHNATNDAVLGCMQGQIAQLMGLTKLVVPNTSVCPGWGNVTITPAAAPAAGA
jgi:hypothetical protein